MLRSRLSLLLLALPLAVACERRDVSISAEPPAVTQVTPVRHDAQQGGPASPEQGLPRATNGVLPAGAADKVLPVGGKPIVKLIEPGAEPRSDLSYTLSKGTTNKMVMAMDMAMGMKAQGQTLPTTTIPRMSMSLDAATVDKNGAEFKIDSHLTSITVDANGGQQEQMARALRPQLETMKGLSMAYWVDPKGHVHDVKLGMPPGMPPAAQQLLGGMSQSFESMVTPLPSEPVGVGAKWQVISRTATGGADLLQSAIYTLKARDGSKATLEVKLIQLAANDTIHTAQMPAGMSAKVKSFGSNGSGTTQVDLKSVAPLGGTMSLKTNMDIAVQGAGSGGDESSVETTTTVTISRP
ncbi:Hypothetical protein A7982_03754 [Minicystis rosea]|nr:Hypothetical protein A7982_03754 [Minicystis rosea]